MLSVRCRRIFTLNSTETDTITVDNHRVVRLGPDAAATDHIDLGDVAIIPPLVNAHTHLEFSDVASPLGNPGNSLPAWIRHVVGKRQSNGQASRAQAIESGLRESRDCGVSMIGDIVTEPWDGQWTHGSYGSPGVAFLEQLSLDESRVSELLETAKQHLINSSPWRPGFSPHAPYSTHPTLVQRLCELSGEMEVPLAMHLAESLEELELLRIGRGEFREMLEGFGAWRDGVFDQPRRPLDYLKLLAKAHHALVIHGNYLDAEERQFAADYGLTVVYCPRTHFFFKHHPYPLADLLQRGVRVALGTDSRASNPDLQLWQEFHFAAAQHSDIPPQQLLKSATLKGSEALGSPFRWEGAAADDLIVVSLEGCAGDDPYEQLLQTTTLQRLGNLLS